LNWGTSDAKTVTLSFYVRSNTTGTYCINLENSTGTIGSASHSYVAEYTINSADTWERKEITIPGPTVGTWATNNTMSIILGWTLETGSDSTTATTDAWQSGRYRQTSNQTTWQQTTGADFHLTGVQLEVGDIATPFEHLSYGEELALCQRYYQVGRSKVSTYRTYAGNWEESWPIIFSTTMRDTPTMGVVTSHTYSNLNGHNTYYPQKYGFSHFCYIAANGQYTSDFTWDAEAEL